jgi:hypothetical protein
MLYKTLNRTVLTYGSETWTLSKESQNVCIFVRRIYGPVKDNGHWRIIYEKLYELYGEPDLVTCIKLKGMSKGWKAHEFLRK